MDAARATVGLQAGEMMARVQFATARKVLEGQKLEGAAVLKLLEGATKPVAASAAHLGQSLNVLA